MCIYSGGAALAYMAVDEALDGVTGAWHDTLPPGKHQLAVHLPSAEGRDVDKQVPVSHRHAQCLLFPAQSVDILT